MHTEKIFLHQPHCAKVFAFYLNCIYCCYCSTCSSA